MEFQFGDWLVSPEANLVSNGDAKTQLEPRVMAVLRYLCRHPGAVIPAEEILQACWGSNELGDNPVHKAITQLRRAFGDSSTEPRYIETIRKRGYRAIAPVVTFAAPPATTWEGGSPFRGLEAFQENHAAIFFGRVQATAQLRELVLTQAAHGCPMALVLGPSGSGKTSLVRAGLLPQLMAGAIRSDEPIGLSSTVYLDCADLGSGTLFQALAGALIDADLNGEPLFPGASADSLGQRLADDPDGVGTELRGRAGKRTQVGVFVDRLEAVFRCENDESDHFFKAVEALAKSTCLLILLACRNDFYPEVMAQPMLLALKTRGGHFDVLPPDGADIAQIVRQPALAANLTFEKNESTGASLDDVLCDAARGSHDMLPLLQYTLNELYRQRSEDGMLKFEVYRQLGGLEGAVGVRAEQVVSRLTPEQISALPHVLSMLVNVGEEQSSVTSRRSPLAMLRTGEEKELVRVMVEARLFVSELAGDIPSFGVAHEALLRRWSRVAEWIERFRGALQLRSRIEGQAARWVAASRPRDQLLPQGSQVSNAADLLKLSDFSLTPLAREYVRASVSRAKLGERIRVGITSLIAVLALLSTALGITARSAERRAEQRRADAEDLMTFMLGDVADKLRPMGRLELLDDISNKAMSYLAVAGSDSASATAVLQRAKALHLIAEVGMSRSKRKEASDAISNARTLLESLDASDANDRKVIKERGWNAFLEGQQYFYTNDWEKAERSMRSYLEFSQRFSNAAPNDIDGWIVLSRAHNSVGTVAIRKGDQDTAVKQFERSMQLKQRALESKPNDNALAVDLANSVSWFAETKANTGQLNQAMELYKKEEQLLRPIHSSNANWSSRLALSKWRQALLNLALGYDSLAQSNFDEAERIMQKIVNEEPGNSAWKLRLHMIQLRQIENNDGSIPQAEALEKLVRIEKSLNTMIETEPKNRTLAYQPAVVQYARGTVYMRSGQRALAIRALEDAAESFGIVRKAAPKDSALANYAAEIYLMRGELAQTKDENKFCENAWETVKPVLEKEPQNYSALSLAARASSCLGNSAAMTAFNEKLSSMSYRNTRFTNYMSTHRRKATP